MLVRLVSLLSIICALAHGEPDTSPFPQKASIKGLQVQMLEDALQLGIHHAGMNITLGSLMDLEMRPGNVRWSCEGREFCFHEVALQRLDAKIKPLSDAGVVVYVILLAPRTRDAAKDKILVHPDARPDGKYSIAAFNSVTPEGRLWLRAVIEMLAHRWSGVSAQKHGRVWGWIVGNELNSHWLWYNMGRKSLGQAVEQYESAFRIVHHAVKTGSAEGRCYISLDHHWGGSMHGISAEESHPGRDFLDRFAHQVRSGGDYDWHLAHHPYPEDLRNPRVWEDKSVTTNDDSHKVSFKNLEVVARHMQRPELCWEGRTRSIILSEQGLHTLPTQDGQLLQAAGYAYAWEKCTRTPGIDAFIYHRHVDNAREGNLRLGLWTHVGKTVSEPHQKKLIYPLFQAAGTPDWQREASFALSICGLSSWDQLTPSAAVETRQE
jgi:hypothetical protein